MRAPALTALGLILPLLFAAAGDAPELTEAQRATLPQYFGFGPFQIYKIKPGISQLRLADLNGDGKTDILLWNAYQSRFEVFYQPGPDTPAGEPRGALERNEIPDRGDLVRDTIPVTYAVATVQVAELTGDGRADIVFFGEPRELVVLPGREGGFGPAESMRVPEGNPRGGALAVGDYNHDGRTDVALLGVRNLLIFHQKPGGGLEKPVRLVHGIQNPLLMLTADLNGDGRDDLLIGSDDVRYGAYIALQDELGSLAALRPLRIPRMRSMTVAPATGGRTGDDLYWIEYASGRLKHYRWQLPPEIGVSPDWPLYLHSYPVQSSSRQRPLALGDVDGDGLVDCVVVDPDAAQFILFKGTQRGLGAGRAFPALTKVTDVFIADIEGDGHKDLLVVSPAEKMIGVSRYEDGRLTFPTALPIEGQPYVVAMGSLAVGGPADCLAYVTKDEDDQYQLVTMRRDRKPLEHIPLEDLGDEPAALRFVDVDQDGRNDLLLFVRFEPPTVLIQNEDGQFVVRKEERSSLLKDVSPAAFTYIDVTGDGKPEVLFAQDNLVRALRIADGSWTVVDQYNPETADARFLGVTAVPGKSGDPTLVMYEQKAGDLVVQKRQEDGTYAVVHSQPVGNFDLAAMQAFSIGEGRWAVLMADADKLAVLHPDERAPTVVEQETYETETRDAWPADAVIGDVNHDGVRDVVLVDMGKASLEVLTTLPDGKLVRALRFQVFQGKRFSEAPDARGEPRQVMIGDVTGDGISDVVVIVHDRLIVYPGQ